MKEIYVLSDGENVIKAFESLVDAREAMKKQKGTKIVGCLYVKEGELNEPRKEEKPKPEGLGRF